ncbi:hypothetical protein DM01DRAFT_1334135 [Hesseltinella vesiculosa]|uniref:RNI-like protein n=1 Tax=Hesseltinella vesiculosa TaxID=101127 RepID=A0A1X2GN10_9FUNG|nr:hypothetical protein DM01DRAFT_1334135 [Hesseltinella vesiculosa]
MTSNPTFFQQKVSPYNPFRAPASPVLSEQNQLSQHHFDQLIRAIRHVLPFLPSWSLHELQCTCSQVEPIVRDFLWRRPQFQSHPTFDSLTLLQRFLKALPSLRQVTRQTIRDLQLTHIHESLYERVPKTFFTDLIAYTPAILTINLAHASFFDFSHLPRTDIQPPVPWQFSRLTSLDVSHVAHMTDPLLLQLATALPQLCLIRLDGTQVDHGVGQLAYHCDHLHSLSLKNTPLTDEALVAIAKFRKIHLTELDLAGCGKITEAGLTMLARYCSHLSWFGVASSPISLATLQRWDHRFWKYLDIAYCSQLHQDIRLSPPSPTSQAKGMTLYQLIMDAPQLQHLGLSIPVLHYLLAAFQRQSQPSKSRISRLILHELPEHTPLALVEDILSLFPRLSYLKLVRGYYESDFLHGTYTSSTRPIQDLARPDITDHTLQAYKPARANEPLTLLLENQRELVLGTSMQYW